MALADGVVDEYYVEMMHQAKVKGNIYKGVINNIDANLSRDALNAGEALAAYIDRQRPDGKTHQRMEAGGAASAATLGDGLSQG